LSEIQNYCQGSRKPRVDAQKICFNSKMGTWIQNERYIHIKFTQKHYHLSVKNLHS